MSVVNLPSPDARARTAFSRSGAGFTLVEIMVVVFIIAILLAIALPNFVRARQSSNSRACVKNLSTIANAKEQYAMDNNLSAGATMPALASLCGPTNYIKQTPECPASGTYSVNNLSTDPTCSVGATEPPPHQL